jgi:hypothetical protein
LFGSSAFLAQLPRYEYRLEGFKPSKRLIINILEIRFLFCAKKADKPKLSKERVPLYQAFL